MAFLKRQKQDISLWRQGIQYSPETLSWTMDFGLTKPPTGMWRYPTSEHCCIYRVPHRLRKVNPEAYTPQLVLIGPLHHHLKSQALQSPEDITNTKLMGYLNMEKHKKIYQAEFARNLVGKETVEGFRRMIQEDEEKIRASYSESTSWIKSSEFVEMILLDSIFILEHMLRVGAHAYYEGPENEKTGDIVVDDLCLHATVKEDLVLLENQLPYFILEKLFDPIFPRLCSPDQSFRSLTLTYFKFQSKIKAESRFRHFTDMFRYAGIDTLGSEEPAKTIFSRLADLFPSVSMKIHESLESTKTKFKHFTNLFQYSDGVGKKAVKYQRIEHMYNAAKLHNAGVNFVAMKNQFSMDVSFDNGCLKLSRLWFDEYMEIILRNIMALEQCHYPSDTRVCNFVTFLDFLIDSEKDMDLLFEKGILNTWTGEQKSMAKMVNKLRLGVIEKYSYYSDIAYEVNAYYNNPINMTRAILDRLYFGNLWKGTATVAAMLLLVMTLIQTIASVLQVIQK